MYAQAEGDAMTIETTAKADNLANLLATLPHGLSSNQHAAFVTRLATLLSRTTQ